ncbi:MAG: hypothetical protein JWM19_3898 [Actinomycetia bacterium]|nr:hypothetical protein [Actinomycetes bacterium]
MEFFLGLLLTLALAWEAADGWQKKGAPMGLSGAHGSQRRPEATKNRRDLRPCQERND